MAVNWDEVDKIDHNGARKRGIGMRGIKGAVVTIFLIVLVLTGLCVLCRYHYGVIEDVGLTSSIMSSITLKNQVMRPIRFDRWTGAVQIYLDKRKWSDLSDWNTDKYQTIQMSVQELKRAGS